MHFNRIDDYALIGDCHSSALVGRDGSIDWACFPRFDSPAVFCKILDAKKGGAFRIAPATGGAAESRAYLPDTNVLVTRFETPEGTLELTDCMPVEALDPGHAAEVRGHSSILRRAKLIAGESMELRIEIAPRFEYGAFAPRFRATSPQTIEVVGGADALWITSNRPLHADFDDLDERLTLKLNEELWVEVAWSSSFTEKRPEDHPDEAELQRRLECSIAYWRAWLGACRYGDGEEFAPAVRRSALTLKALTYAPTGAVVAAPTTSLPEEIGGERNWDYRYTWIRDTTLTLISLLVLGFRGEADGFRQWLRRTSAGRPGDLQIMYGIEGQRSLPEVELSHLAGHRDSRPVRIGNGAVKQLQLDCYGSILQAVYIYTKAGGAVTPTNWAFLHGLAEIVRERWDKPDQGIWEIRDEPRHFIHSKLLCWVAMDRAIRLAEQLDANADGIRGSDGANSSDYARAPLDAWRTTRDSIADYLLTEGARDGWFPQAVGRREADASSLLVPAMGFLPPTHPLVLATIDEVRRSLENQGLVYRYLNADGLQGHEGGFLLCSFWLLDALIHSRRPDEAESLLARLLELENDVGLYAEEALPDTGEGIGNFPQAFTHMALVTSCTHLQAARRGQLPPADQAYDFAEFALGSLVRD